MAHLVDLYASASTPALCLQVAPAALPADWDDICVRHGIVGGSVWAKLLRPAATPTTPSTTDLRVGTIGPEDAEAYARVFAGGFGMPPEPHLLSMFAAAGGSGPGFTAYGAWDGDELVAAANLHVAGPAAAFCGAATLSEARGRGAQSAFMQLRVEAAGAGRLHVDERGDVAGARGESQPVAPQHAALWLRRGLRPPQLGLAAGGLDDHVRHRDVGVARCPPGRPSSSSALGCST